jgi:hypothetical protein
MSERRLGSKITLRPMTEPHVLWVPPDQRPKPKPRKIDHRRKQRMNAAKLSVVLRDTIDAAMILSRDTRTNLAAVRRLRRLLDEYPNALSRSHISWNLGPRRIAWVESYFGDE